MNINDLPSIIAQDEEGAVVPIFQKNGDPYLALDGKTQSTFTVVGTESKKYQEAKRAHQKRVFSLLKRSGGNSLDPEVANIEDIKLAARAVTAFSGWDDGKKDLEFTPENVKRLLSAPHIYNQVIAGINGHADFFTRNSTG